MFRRVIGNKYNVLHEPVVATQCMMHWAQAIALQGSSIGCIRVSKHTGHSSWSETDRLFFAKGGLGSGYSGGMTGGGVFLLTLRMIMLGFIPGKQHPFSSDIVQGFFCSFASTPLALS